MSGDGDKFLHILTEAGIDKEDARFEMRFFREKAGGEDELLSFVQRRAEGEPAAYILGEKDFYKDVFYVEEGVLIPRSDTELLVEAALRYLGFCNMPLGDVASVPVRPDAGPSRIRIADLCTGSGCVGISVANEIARNGREAMCYLCDISETALDVSEKNIWLCGSAPDSFHVCREDVLSSECAIAEYGPFDVISANPPYIDKKDMAELPFDVDRYEPHLALYGGEDGLDFYRKMTVKYRPLIKDGGAFIFEHGYNQGDAVRAILEASGYSDVMTLRDYGGNPRVSMGIRRS